MIDDWGSYALADFLPFTAEVYVGLVDQVNAAWWPLHLPVVLLGLVALGLAWRGRSRAALLLLTPAWVFAGIVFHLGRYAELVWAAPYFGWIFLVQGALLLAFALFGRDKEPRPGPTPMATAGLFLALFGLVVYPLFALVSGDGWRGAEVFALHPDPTAVTTLGLVMVARIGFRAMLSAIVPLLWLQIASLTLVALQEPRGWLLMGVVGLVLLGVVAEAAVRRVTRR